MGKSRGKLSMRGAASSVGDGMEVAGCDVSAVEAVVGVSGSGVGEEVQAESANAPPMTSTARATKRDLGRKGNN
jgi:hypothetical protein